MKISKIMRICVYSLSALGGLFATITMVTQFGALFQLLFSASFLGGVFMLAAIALAVLWVVFAVLGLVLFIVKGDEAGKKSNDFGLYCSRLVPAYILLTIVVLVPLGSYLFLDPQTAFQWLLSFFTYPGFWVLLVGVVVSNILVKVAKKNDNKVTVAVLKGIAALLPFVGIMVFGLSGALLIVGAICGLVALVGDIVIPFVEGK